MNVTKLVKWGAATCSQTHKCTRFRPNLLEHRVLPIMQTQTCLVSTVETKALKKKESVLTRIVAKIPFLNIQKYRIMSCAYLLYEGVADKINYMDFFQTLELADTFYSWFVITELHLYMISARVMADGVDGRHLRKYLLEAFWNDVSQRAKKLGGEVNPTIVRGQVQDLSEQLQAALFAYDEGLLSNDVVLAGALWRRFYQQNDVDPVHLDILVKYVRKQMRLLDHMSLDMFLTTQKVDWIPLNK